MTDSGKRAAVIAIVVAVLLACWFIPVEHWDSYPASGRYTNDAVIAGRSGDSIRVQLDGTATFLMLKGNIPSSAHEGQRVRIGYSKLGLYEDVHQKVEVSYFVNGNLLWMLFARFVNPPHFAADGLQIVSMDSDGSHIEFNKMK